jgi:hypothetical protein
VVLELPAVPDDFWLLPVVLLVAEPAEDEPVAEEPAEDAPVLEEPALLELPAVPEDFWLLPVLLLVAEPAEDEPAAEEPAADVPVLEVPALLEPAVDPEDLLPDELPADELPVDELPADAPMVDEPAEALPAEEVLAEAEPVELEPVLVALPVEPDAFWLLLELLPVDVPPAPVPPVEDALLDVPVLAVDCFWLLLWVDCPNAIGAAKLRDSSRVVNSGLGIFMVEAPLQKVERRSKVSTPWVMG